MPATFSIFAFEALRKELERVESFEFIFTSPTFVPGEVTDKLRKERREFHIPKLEREGESLSAHVERMEALQRTQKEIQKLESRIAKEKQFNRRVELNQELRML